MYRFKTTTGVGPAPLDVSYDIDEDGQVQDVAIYWMSLEVSALLTEYTNNCIEMECAADYRKREAAEIVEFNLDRGEQLYRERQAA